MDTKQKELSVETSSYKRTKIIATIGPATGSYETILGLIKAGANGLRLNFSHGNNEEKVDQIKMIRKASKELAKPVSIIQDLHGPKMQLGDIEPMELNKGDVVHFAYHKDAIKGTIPTMYDLSKKVKKGQRLSIFDGKIRTNITSVSNGVVTVEVQNSGFIMKFKGINIPDTDLKGDILTEKDKADLRFGAENDFDYVAVSFVQTADDILYVKQYLARLGAKMQVIAKVETKAATDRLESIARAADGIMVARGDLAIETEPESVPIVQRKIIGLCQQYGKISIVATQMLASMTESPEPTRAEVSDVATAVIVGSDAVMLSEETAIGDYPVEAVKFMKRIVTYTEANSPVKPLFSNPEDNSIQTALSSAVMTLAHRINSKAIVAVTSSGNTARSIAALRPNMPIIMVTEDPHVANQLALVYGGKAYVRKTSADAGERMTDWLKNNKILRRGDMVVMTTGKYPGQIGGTDTIKVRRII